MQEKWTKLRTNVLLRTKDLADAAVLSFIMDGAEIQKTDSPIIAKSFISESLTLGDWQTQNSIGRLLDEGWFTSIEHVKFEKYEGVKVPSTKFNLSGRSIGGGEGMWRRFEKKETVQSLKNQANEVY